MGHTQPPKMIQVDNTTANTFYNKTLNQKRSKSIDIQFYWMQDICDQWQFKLFWRLAATNLVDYHTKHHSHANHRLIGHKYLHTENLINQLKVCLLQGWVSSLGVAHPHTMGNYRYK